MMLDGQVKSLAEDLRSQTAMGTDGRMSFNAMKNGLFSYVC